MKKKWLGIAALLILAGPAASAVAAPRGVFHGGGFRGSHGGRVIIHGGGWINPYWGWYGYPGYYSGYYGRPYGYGYSGYGYPGYGYSGYGYSGYGADSNWGAVKTDVDPEEARVYLDGKYIGTADDFDGWPDKLYLRPGHYRVEFRLSGYEPLSLDVDARPGQELKIDNKLRKGDSGLRTQADPPKIEGNVQRYFGKRRRERDRDRDDVRPYRRNGNPAVEDDGRNRVSAEDEDEDAAAYADAGPERDMDVDRNQTLKAPVRAPAPAETWRNNSSAPRPSAPRPDATVSARPVAADRSRLKISAQPADAAVYLDDRFVGSADELASMSAGIVVSPGKHTVTISRPGYKDRSASVQVSNGRTETVDLSLTR